MMRRISSDLAREMNRTNDEKEGRNQGVAWKMVMEEMVYMRKTGRCCDG